MKMHRTNQRCVRLVLWLAPILVCLSGLGHQAQAAVESGKVEGTVYDPDGVPLPGIEVVLESAELMGARRNITARDGDFLFYGLPPGRYTVQIYIEGFLPFEQTNIKVRIGGTASLDILMEVPTSEEVVVVTARRPVVDKEKTSIGQSFDDEFLETIPVGRSYQGVALLVPGVVGGSNPNVHGGSLYSNQYFIDGINTTDPATNTWSFEANRDAYKEVQIITGGIDAQYGGTSGGIINIVTKKGGNEFSLDTTILARPNALVLRDEFEKDTGADEMYIYSLNLGGPVANDRIWYFASVQLGRTVSSIAPTEDWFDHTNPDLLQHPSMKVWNLQYLAKLTFQLNNNHSITAMTLGAPSWMENTVQDSTFAPDAEERRYQYGGFYSLVWEALWSKYLFQKTQVGLAYSGMQQDPMNGCSDIQDKECRTHIDVATGFITNNYYRASEDHRYRLQFDSIWTLYVDDFLGEHELKFGWNYAYTWMTFDFAYTGGGYFMNQNGEPYQVALMKPGEDGQLRSNLSENKGQSASVFFQDAWQLGQDFIIKPGVRVDWVQTTNTQGDVIVDFLTASPRINFVWDVTGDGRTVLRGGYNRYTDTSWFNIANMIGRNLEMEFWQYNPNTGDYDFFISSSGGTGGYILGKDSTAPHSDEFSLMIEREIMEDFSIGLAGVYRESKHVFEDREINQIYNQEGDQIIGYANGEETDVKSIENPKGAWRRYWGVELSAVKHLSDNWDLSASYTYSHAQGTTESYFDIYLNNPRQDKYMWGYMSFDRRHVFKLSGSYRVPFGLICGFWLSWATGQPYSTLYAGRDGSFSNYRSGRYYDPSHPKNPYWSRVPDRLNVNVRLAWNLKELTGQGIEVYANVFNALHLRYKTDIEVAKREEGSGREYGQYYQMTDGLSAQIGLRYRY